ncbi:MAG TPA: ATP-binding protein [Chloroflexota bacterium]|nr:ATP-binding protein [Chloroflexota bacterium]
MGDEDAAGGRQSLAIETQSDVEQARRIARAAARAVGFSALVTEEIVLAVSELATNLVRYAHHGKMTFVPLGQPRGIRVESVDHGPGIPDLQLAMRDGYSTSGGLGGGLPSVKRLMDEFQMTSTPKGTTIVAGKWLKS